MGLVTITDMDLSTDIPRTELRDLIPDDIPDDIWKAAHAASQDDSDEEDPFGPQPKRFMQTEHQKNQRKRDLEIRQVAYIIRKMRKDRKAKQQRLKEQKQRASPVQILHSDLILRLMQQTHPEYLLDLVNSSPINHEIFKANKAAIYRGIELEQFPDWRWLFGDTIRRTSAQVQHLKNAICVENHFRNDGTRGLRWWDEQLLEVLGKIDNNMFTGMRRVMFLQELQDHVDEDIEATESYTEKRVARRTEMCLRSFSFQRPEVVKEEDRMDNGPLICCTGISWKARSQVVCEQPASIQSEIRSLLQDVVRDIYEQLEEVLTRWTWWHYDSAGNHRKPEEVKKWMSQLVTGLVMEEVIPQWYSDTINSRITLCFARESFSFELEDELIRLLNWRGGGPLETLEVVEDSVEFGRAIGLDVEGLVDGTLVGGWIEYLGWEDETED